ncbi:hypothetical protein [Phenylobacterium sp.]
MRARALAAAVLGLLAGLLAACAGMVRPEPSEGMRAPDVPTVTLWRKRF